MKVNGRGGNLTPPATQKGIRPLKTEWWGTGVVICLERGADLHMAQLMPLPLTVSCSSKIQIGFTFLVPAYPDCPGKEAVKWLLLLLCNSLLLELLKAVCCKFVEPATWCNHTGYMLTVSLFMLLIWHSNYFLIEIF